MIIDTVDEGNTFVEELIGGRVTAEQTEFLQIFVTGGVQKLVEDMVISLSGTLMDDTILFQKICR